MKYAISTMVFWWHETPLSFEQECELLKSLGFGIEIWPHIKGDYQCRYSRGNWNRLRSATEGMLVSMRSRNDHPTLEQWDEQIQCAKSLNANIVTDLQSLGVGDGQAVNGFAGDVVKMADEHGVKLCLETGQLPKLKELGEKYSSLWYCLDVGYVNLDGKFTFKEYVDELGERVAHLHLTDNYGHIDDHEPPGLRGGISRDNWSYLLETLQKCDNEIIGSFEMCPCSPFVMIRQAGEFLFGELNWPNRPKPLPHPIYSNLW